ncbi:unnamed protein product [Cylindrotheca closterium]|uniref:Protein xylosyltransferase n=1 Tax=Cylindrotheca closterium TaxID=2856 RepID=A0AAD2FQY6_9STRA|nr:unnamed protein product [Cylindrotheca closterium]
MQSNGERRSLVIRLIFFLTLAYAVQHQSKLLKSIGVFQESSSPNTNQAEVPWNHNVDGETIKTVENFKNAAREDTDSKALNGDGEPARLENKLKSLGNQVVTTITDDGQLLTTTPHHPPSQQPPCALLFFGLIKDFVELALPAIRRHILQPNPQCDVFLHTYNITVTRISRRNLEQAFTVQTEEAYHLTNHVAFDTEWTFEDEHAKFLRRTRRLYHREWGACCKSHDNMIKQWHSIKRVWDLMVDHEKGKLLNINNQGSETKKHDYYYEQIGLFRSDVFYTSPIDIFDSNATLPNFASYKGYNDRLFYGQRQYAQVWADRFSFAPIFEKQYMVSSITRGKKRGYHSESFLFHLLNHYKVPVELQNICVWRIRTGARLTVEDCTRESNWFSKDDISKYLPRGYTIQVVEDVKKLRNGKNKTSSSLLGFPQPDNNGNVNIIP